MERSTWQISEAFCQQLSECTILEAGPLALVKSPDEGSPDPELVLSEAASYFLTHKNHT